MSLPISTPSGTATIKTELVASEHVQHFKWVLGAAGAAVLVDASNPVPVQHQGVLNADVGDMPPANWTTDTVSAGIAFNRGLYGTVPVEPSRNFLNVASATSDAVLFAGVTGDVFLITGVVLSCGATATTVTFNSKPAGASSAISSLISLPINGTFQAFNHWGLFKPTTVNDALTVTTGTGGTVGVNVTAMRYTVV